MSGPPLYAQQRPSTASPAEDCRDYLRTGRCKYGGQCKYHHPANVQSGGGLRGPIDPNEPLFPVRPNEPTCQYYLKHGTCKFGQACKFNHPPHGQQPLKAVINGNNSAAVLVNVTRNEGQHQVLFDQVATDANGNLMMLQFLPQRPDEPDCIYFLKNGRCKYGGTCRYHHPINLNQRRFNSGGGGAADDQRRNRSNAQDQYRVAPNVQYVSQLVPAFAHNNVSDGQPVTYYKIDSTSVSQGFKPVQIVSAAATATAADGTATSFAVPLNDAVAGSSSTSLASSFETAGSTMDHLGDASGNIWNRARRHGSGGSLNTSIAEASQTRMHNVASEGNIRQRLRAASYGSDCNGSQYDTSTMTSATSVQSMSRNTSAGSWRNDRPSEASRRPPQNSQYALQVPSGQSQHISSKRSPQIRDQATIRRSSRARGQQSEENDEGLTMMTSALLTMLDTTEEAGVGINGDEDERYPSASYHMEPTVFEEQFERMAMQQPPPGLGPGNNSARSSWAATLQGSSNLYGASRNHPNGQMESLVDQSSQDADLGLYFP
ncbi:hypothetical protein MPSEU_000478900 [Mayamaea pseudoterrestris]|nr:hypothetical protein MPSEU_000478900 [Mayamaea pseudoterrestris]